MEKGELEEKLKSIVGKPGEQTDLGMKLRKVFQRAKETLEKKVINSSFFSRAFFFKLMKEEGILPAESEKPYSILSDISSHFLKKYNVKTGRGVGYTFYFLENTPLPEETKKNMAVYDELSSKVEVYVKEHNGKPDPKAFKDFVYSLLSPNDLDSILSGKVNYDFSPPQQDEFYEQMRFEYKVEEYKPMDIEKLGKDIKSELDKI